MIIKPRPSSERWTQLNLRFCQNGGHNSSSNNEKGVNWIENQGENQGENIFKILQNSVK